MRRFARLTAVFSRLASYDRWGSMPYGQEKSVVSCERRIKFSIDSTATREATSPAAWPPIPSATTNRRKSSALTKQSSFMWRTGPVSLKPNAVKGSGRSLSRRSDRRYYFGSNESARNPPEIPNKSKGVSGQLAGQLGPRIDADLLEDSGQVLLGGGRGDP